MTIVVIPSVTGTITDTASVGADRPILTPADNQVTVLVATTLDMPINVFSSLVKTSKGPYGVLVTWGYPNSAQSGISFNVYRVDASGSEIKVSGPAGTSAHDFVDTGAAANKTTSTESPLSSGSGESARSDETKIVVTLNNPSGPGASSSRRATDRPRVRRLDLKATGECGQAINNSPTPASSPRETLIAGSAEDHQVAHKPPLI